MPKKTLRYRSVLAAFAGSATLALSIGCDDAARYRYPVLGSDFPGAAREASSPSTLQPAAAEAAASRPG